MKLFDLFKEKNDLILKVTERERKYASGKRLALISEHEKEMKAQADKLRKDFEKELKEKLEKKDNEIFNLKKLINHLKHSFENLHSLSGELALEFRTVAILAGKSQNRFVNIQDRALREAEHIESKIGKFIGNNEVL